jgi:hypothetical protein
MKTKLLFLALTIFCSAITNAQWQQTSVYGFSAYGVSISGANTFAGTNTGIYISPDDGVSWSLANTGVADAASTIVTSGTNIFAATGGGVYLSNNNGGSWTLVNNGLINTGVSSLLISGANIFAGTAGGVFVSANNGSSWTAVNNGLTSLDVQALAVNGSNIFAATYSGGVFLSSNNGASWAAVNNGLPPPANAGIYSLAIMGSDIFAGTEGYGVFRSSNNGTSWTATGFIASPYAIIPSLAVSGTNIFAGTFFNGVFLSTNNGNTWTPVNTGLNMSDSLAFFSLAVSANTLFAGTLDANGGGGVLKRPLSEMISGINEINIANSISIFPNPFSSTTTLQTDEFFKNATLTVHNSLGQTVKQIKNISGQTVTLSRDNLPSGLYFLRLTEENKTIAVDKLVITDN